MELLQAIILGIVQGLTEFIPVSSSGHLVLVPAFFGWDDQGLAFDVGLHVGTMVAVIGYFWRDWWRMATSSLGDLGSGALIRLQPRRDTQMLLLLAVGTIPAGIVALLFDDWIEANLREPWLVAVALAVAGTVMLVAERLGRMDRAMEGVGLRDVVVIGLAQACALFPGVSRSGATISAGLAVGLRRDDAARFTFLLGTPAFAGAALLKAFDLGGEDSPNLWFLAAGMVTSGVVGFAAIHYLLRFLRTRTLVPFVIYRYVLAAVTLLAVAFGGI